MQVDCRQPESATGVLGRSEPMRFALRVFVLVLVGYIVGAEVSAQFFGVVAASSFFPPAGLTVAAMLLTRRSVWPVIAAAVLVGEVLVDLDGGSALPLTAGYALANIVEPLIGASVVRIWCPETPDLRRTKDFIIFLGGACLAGPLVGAAVGGMASHLTQGTPWLTTALRWFAGDVISVLVIGSSILLWRKQFYILRARPVETLGILVAALGLSIVGFGSSLPPALAVLPVLAWAAVRASVLGTALTGVVIAAVGNFMTGSHLGQLGNMKLPDPFRVAVAQIFLAVLVLVAMVVAQEVSHRRMALRERDAERGERLRLESLSRLALRLSAELTPRDVGSALEQQLLADVDATSFKLGLLNHDGSKLEWIVAAGDLWSSSEPVDGPLLTDHCIATDATRSGHMIIAHSAGENGQGYGYGCEGLRIAEAESLGAWPLFSGEKAIGVILLAWAQRQPFDAEQLAYLSTVASMAGPALVRAKSYADEHARALVLHAAAHPTAQVSSVGMDYRAYYRPSDATDGLGGDWYSVFPLPSGRTFLSVGDVMGHGLMAVEDMAQLRSTGNAYAHQGLRPAQVLGELNLFAASQMRRGFATNLIAVFDPAANLVTLSSAGHPPALLRRANTGEVVRLSGGLGPVLGPVGDAVYAESAVHVGPGDVLVMYTDGLVEHEDCSLEVGIVRLQQMIASLPSGDLLDCEAIAESVAPSPRLDDVCLLIARFGTVFGDSENPTPSSDTAFCLAT